MLRRIRRLEVEAIAGLIAAVTALVLHLLHVVEADVLLSVILVILALMLIRDFRREERDERLHDAWRRTEAIVTRLGDSVRPPDVTLIGPLQLREVSVEFSREARGEMVWFNVCLSMFEPQELFDVLLRPALENPRITGVQFILDERERERWERAVLPKARGTSGFSKLREPGWIALDEPVSTIIAETESGQTEALLSFWGEPFMARASGLDVPRYIFRVHGHSELVARLTELARTTRLRTR